MNERIRQLAIKADIMAPYSNYEPLGYQKFAELIVRECAGLCEHESNDDEYDQYDMGMSVKAENIKTAIRQHFGVEE